MKKASAYKLLKPQEKQFLSDIAKDVAMLVSKPEKMDCFREQLTEFSNQWKAYKRAYEADRKGKWQPWMGKPSNPLGTIWPIIYGNGWRNPASFSYNPRNLMQWFPCVGDVRTILGAYALLAVIQDKVLPHCPLLAKDIFPKELTQEIWRNLLTGVDVDGSKEMVVWARKDIIKGFLDWVRKEISERFGLLKEPPIIKRPNKGAALAKVPTEKEQERIKVEDIEQPKAKSVKEPSKEATQAYKLYYGSGKSQSEVAEIMTKKLRKPVNQGQVSRWVTEYKKWAKAYDIPIPEKPTIINMSSNKLDMGKRTDGKRTGDPHHKAKFDPDGEAYE